MAPSEVPSQTPTSYVPQRITSRMKHGQRRARAFQLAQASASPNGTPRIEPTNGRQRRRNLRASQRSRASTNTTPNTSTGLLHHDADQLGKTVPEFRATMKRADLDDRRRPRHRRGSCSGSESDQDQEERLPSWYNQDEETVEEDIGLLKRDWEKDDEESERPCYWRLLKKLNRELRVTGE